MKNFSVVVLGIGLLISQWTIISQHKRIGELREAQQRLSEADEKLRAADDRLKSADAELKNNCDAVKAEVERALRR